MKETSRSKRPAVVFLHSTHKCKEWLRPLLEVAVLLDFLGCVNLSWIINIRLMGIVTFIFQAYASRGYIAVAIDSRYHGERASSLTTYRDVCPWHCDFVLPTHRLLWLIGIMSSNYVNNPCLAKESALFHEEVTLWLSCLSIFLETHAFLFLPFVGLWIAGTCIIMEKGRHYAIHIWYGKPLLASPSLLSPVP